MKKRGCPGPPDGSCPRDTEAIGPQTPEAYVFRVTQASPALPACQEASRCRGSLLCAPSRDRFQITAAPCGLRAMANTVPAGSLLKATRKRPVLISRTGVDNGGPKRGSVVGSKDVSSADSSFAVAAA